MSSKNYTKMSDQKLVENIQSCSDRFAFEELWLRRKRKMYQKCISRYGLRKQDAEDVVAIASIKVWNGIDKFTYKTQYEFQAWLNIILERAVIDFEKKEAKIQDVLSTISLDRDVRTHDDSSTKIEETIHDAQYDAFIKKHWRKYHVLEIAKQNNASYREIKVLKHLLFSEPLPATISQNNLAKIKSRLFLKLKVWLDTDFG